MKHLSWFAVVLVGQALCGGTSYAAVTTKSPVLMAGKLKAQGKLLSCLSKNAAHMIAGKLDKSAGCQGTFQAKVIKLDARARPLGIRVRYVTNSDSTISDLNTGLVWVLDTPADVQWNAGGFSATSPDGVVFFDYLYHLNRSISPDGISWSGCFAGHCDWRLPTIDELREIVDHTQGSCAGGQGACIDPVFQFGISPSYLEWSSTTDSADPSRAWVVDLLHGGSVSLSKQSGAGIFAVRGGLTVRYLTPASSSPAQGCRQAKLIAQGKLLACLRNNTAAVMTGHPDSSASCQTAFQGALASIGSGCRYLDNGDGTTSDLNSPGLMWTVANNGGNWAITYPFPTDWADGGVFTVGLYSLNRGRSSDGIASSGCFAGYCDWRLPTIQELAGLLDRTQGRCAGGFGPCIDPVFRNFNETYAFWSFPFWSSTIVTDSGGEAAWAVDFFYGHSRAEPKRYDENLLAVRGWGGLCDAGTCFSVCGDGICGVGEICANCPVDCGVCCGNGTCGAGETCTNCQADCGACVCGNHSCDVGETCSSCPSDCGACVCGNGTCDAGENCSNCAVDCGCPAGQMCNAGLCTSPCGNGTCDPGETCSNCPTDCGSCCGNGTCDAGETCSTCPQDCVCPTGHVCNGGTGMCDSPKRVFLLTTSTGNLGGVIGANVRCQNAASAAGITGTFKAWISDGAASPAATFTHSAAPYYQQYAADAGGQRLTVANDWADLTDGSIQSDVTADQTGHDDSRCYNPAVGIFGCWAWTNVLPSGLPDSGPDCAHWTSGSAAVQGRAAYNTAAGNAGNTWTTENGPGGIDCDAGNSGLYCFEQ